MDCTACGNVITGRGLFCMKCGEPVLQVKNPTASQSIAHVSLTKRPAIITHFAVLYGLTALAIAASIFIFAAVGAQWMILSALGIALVFAFFAFAMFSMMPSARIILIFFSVIGLLGFPFGTIFYGFMLAYLFQPGVKALFAGKSSFTLTPDERGAIEKLRASWWNRGMVIAFWGLTLAGMIATSIALKPQVTHLSNQIRQLRTMATMTTIDRQLRIYAIGKRSYPQADNIDDLEAEIREAITPDFEMPKDGWGNPFDYRSAGSSNYFLVSAGSDGEFESSRAHNVQETTDSFDYDIVMRAGEMIRWAEAEMPGVIEDDEEPDEEVKSGKGKEGQVSILHFLFRTGQNARRLCSTCYDLRVPPRSVSLLSIPFLPA